MTKTHTKSYKFGPYRLEIDSGRLLKNEIPIPLTRKRFEILLVLIDKSGLVVRKDEIMRQVWLDQPVEESSLTQHIFYLRRILEDDPRIPQYIITIPGTGYLFYQSVVVVNEDGSEETIGGLQQAQPDPDSTGSDATQTAIDPEFRLLRDQSPAQSPSRDIGGIRPLARGFKSGHWLALFAVLGLVIVGFGIFYYRQLRALVSRPAIPTIVPFITTPGLKGDLVFSHDGQSLAFSTEGDTIGSQNIYVKQIGADNPIRLTTYQGTDHSFCWSPDNREIAFLRWPMESGRKNLIMITPVTGGPAREIGETWNGLDWSPDGKYLAISDSEGPDSATGIYLLSLDGNSRRAISNPPRRENLFDSDPRFSPDGRSLAFVRWSSNVSGDLFVTDLTDKSIRQLTFDRREIPAIQWSSDGREILFISNRTDNHRMWRIPVKGGQPIPVNGILGEVSRFSLSPKDDSIAYTQRFFDTNILINRLPARSQGMVTVPADFAQINDSRFAPCMIVSTRSDDSPQFSPDGSKIAFMSGRSGFDEIWLASSDCSNPSQLTAFRQNGVGSPRWSPDGTRIAFDRYVDGQPDIFTIDVNTRLLKQLTDKRGFDYLPAWSNDGKWIYFRSEMGTFAQIWKVLADGGEPIQLTQRGGRESWESFDARFLYYTRLDFLWSKDLLTGIEQPITQMDNIQVGRYWTVTRSAIYYITRELGGKTRIHRFDLKTRQISTIMELDGSPARYVPGLSISADESHIAISLINYQTNDISLVTGWR